MQNPTLSDVVTTLGQKYGVNIIADAYLTDVPADPRIGRVTIKDVPLSTALPKLAQLYDRNMEIVYGIVVWRHSKAVLHVSSDENLKQEYHVSWKDNGKVSAKREGIRPTSASLLTNTPEPLPAPKTNSEDILPARLVSLEVEQASAHDVAQSLSLSSGWSVAVAAEVETRRVSMQLHRVTPAQAAELLTLVLNARQRLVIGQSEAQKQQEATVLKNVYDFRSPRQKQSEALRADLVKALTPEQRTKLANNEILDINVTSLPASLQKRAMEYVNLVIGDMKTGVPDFPDLDRKRGFSLNLRPETGLCIGVTGYAPDGELWGF